MRGRGIGQGAFAELKMVMTEVLFSSGLQNRVILTTKGLAKGITEERGLVDGKSCLEEVFWKQELSQRALGELVSGWGATPSASKVGLAMRIAGSPTLSSSHPRILCTRPHKVESSILQYSPKGEEEEFYTSSAAARLQNSCGRSYCSRISRISRIELSLKRE